MKMTSATLKEFRGKFADAVNALELEYGVNISLGRMTYSTDDFRCKLTVTNSGTGQSEVDGVTKNKNVQSKDDFETCARILDVPAEWYEKVFTKGSKTYQITSLSLNRPKNAVGLIDVRTGGGFKGSIYAVKSMLRD